MAQNFWRKSAAFGWLRFNFMLACLFSASAFSVMALPFSVLTMHEATPSSVSVVLEPSKLAPFALFCGQTYAAAVKSHPLLISVRWAKRNGPPEIKRANPIQFLV